MLKKIDIYIIRKFLGTFFLAIVLIIVIAVVFDVSEKLDDFINEPVTLKEIIFDYYFNFIPYFVNLFSPLFTFIAVILFTSKMAEQSEIIAILSTGTSFNRLVRPYMISAGIIALLTFTLSSYIIPPANAERLEFQDKYIKKRKSDNAAQIQMRVSKEEILYIDYYEKEKKCGYRCTLEKFNGKTLVSKLTADSLVWDTAFSWSARKYMLREFDGMYEKLTRGDRLDLTIQVEPEDFFIYKGMQEEMSNRQLRHYISRQKDRGIGNIKEFEIEYAKRFSFPFAAFILTLIGVSLSSRKVRGGMGLNMALGLLLSFSYILFYTVSSTFAVSGTLSPTLSVWLPNFVFAIIAAILYRKAVK
ncbi:MAG TPA: LptF/LptG family permease [Paludibacteraceae bacterium]|nr:LptF/LptG family permease [Paludibacteraceae bacterium]HOU66994.1 LptF/LptG family permease [Paludibacteraceae bacterium]HPH62396.1 LptF/LptG family permease [Paludibacteraceae bacterium]HQF49197.1 LptF/LptG family permease [Paludibacteraceae bacterium]